MTYTYTDMDGLLMSRAGWVALTGLVVVLVVAGFRWWINRPSLRKTLFEAQAALIKETMRAQSLQASLDRSLAQPREVMDWLRSQQGDRLDDYGRGWETCAEEVMERLTYRGLVAPPGACWVPGCTRPAKVDSLYCMEAHPSRDADDGAVKGDRP